MKIFNKLSSLLLLVTLVFAGCEQPSNVQKKKDSSKITPALKKKAQVMIDSNGQPISGQYIVVYKPKNGKVKMSAPNTRSQTRAIQSEYHITQANMKQQYTHSIRGFMAKLDNKQLKKLRNDSRVDYVEQDRRVQLTPPHAESMNSTYCIFFGIGCQEGSSEPQVTPYGIERVDGPGNVSGDHKAWVIDTGIDLDHEDLNVDTTDSRAFLSPISLIFGGGTDTPNDENGHGTNVAGIIAAKNNDIDVVGVAPGIPVVSVCVLNASGTGINSDIIAGVDYVGSSASPGDVVNMSLGGIKSQALDDAVKNAAGNGIDFVIAAGNDNQHANTSSPADVNDDHVYTVSAVNSLDEFAPFSNFGNPPIDYAAPGVGIKSLWKDNGTNTVSGTSQATPHVAGVLLLTSGQPNTEGTAKNDPDGSPDPIIHQ